MPKPPQYIAQDFAQPDRRRIILAGTALLGAAALPGAVASATETGLAPAADLLAGVRTFLSSLEPDKRKAASFAWNGSEWKNWNYFGVGEIHQTRPSAGTDDCGAEGDCLGSARDRLVAGRTAKGKERHDAARRAGSKRQRRRPAVLGAVFVFGVRHAVRDRRVGLAHRRPPPDPVGRRAQRPDRFGDAVVVLVVSQSRHGRGAFGPGHAQGRGGAGAAAGWRSCAGVAGAGARLGRAAEQHHVVCWTRTRQRGENRSAGRRNCVRRSATCCGS